MVCFVVFATITECDALRLSEKIQKEENLLGSGFTHKIFVNKLKVNSKLCTRPCNWHARYANDGCVKKITKMVNDFSYFSSFISRWKVLENSSRFFICLINCGSSSSSSLNFYAYEKFITDLQKQYYSRQISTYRNISIIIVPDSYLSVNQAEICYC